MVAAGLVATVDALPGAVYIPWIRLYNLTFIVGVAWSFTLFWALNVIFPVSGLGSEAQFTGNELVGIDPTKLSGEVDVKELEGKAESEA